MNYRRAIVPAIVGVGLLVAAVFGVREAQAHHAFVGVNLHKKPVTRSREVARKNLRAETAVRSPAL